MPDKPEYVKLFEATKPKNTEVRPVHGKWYLYEIKNVYDPEIKRTRKKTVRYLGIVGENGLIPKGSGRTVAPALNDVVEAGASYYVHERTGLMRARLQRHFPDMWEQIYVIAALRAVYGGRMRRLPLHYEDSALSYMYPGMNLSAPAVTELLNALGRQRGNISDYMKESISGGERYILFDGHRLLSLSHGVDNAEPGYDSRMRYKPQINLIYMFALENESAYPAYYKQYIGSTPDISAFPDILRETGALEGNCTVIADKGFAAEAGFELLGEYGMKYVMPLKRGNRFVKGRVPASPTDYDGVFIYHGRSIHSVSFCEDDSAIHLFLDLSLLSEECADAVARAEKKNRETEAKRIREESLRKKGKGRMSDEELASLVPLNVKDLYEDKEEMGTVTLRTNRTDLNAEQVYRIYKQRQTIEQFFKTYDDTLEFDSSYMRNNYTKEAWLFLNHLSACITVDAIEEIGRLEQTKNISYKDLMQTLIKIKVVKIDDKWSLPPMKRSVQKLCEKMKLEFKNLPELSH